MKGKQSKGKSKSKGSNLSFGKPSQSIHVSPMKDEMAKNVGGSDHMNGPAGAEGHEEFIGTGAAMKGPKHMKDRY